MLQHLGDARILDELANGSRDTLPQAHAENILKHRKLEASTNIKGVAHGTDGLPEEELVGDGVQPLGKLHELAEAAAQPRFPALKRGGHFAHIVFEVQNSAVVEEAAPLRIKTHHIEVVA